jgi:hypothetical protein
MKLYLPSLLTIRPRPFGYFCLLSALALAYSPMALAAPQSGAKPAAVPHVELRPKLVPGEVLVYRIQLQTITDTKPTGAVSDPQGPSRLAVTWDATVKLEVLGELAQTPAAPPPPAAKPGAGKPDGGQEARRSSPAAAPQAAPQAAPLAPPLRIRTTYEHSAASVKGDSPDPQADEIEERYAQLDGRAIEFTVGTDGHVSEVHGLDNVFENDQVRQAAEQWMLQVSSPAMVPGGVAIGQSWNSAQPAVSMPLAEMVWRSNSTYLRNESCRPADTGPASKESCAVILTRQSVLPRKQVHDPTPDDYRRNGLHTAGTWTGSGESLSYVSLETHVAVSVTQDSAQQIDFTVTNAEGASIRYAGNIETHSRVELLPQEGDGPR